MRTGAYNIGTAVLGASFLPADVTAEVADRAFAEAQEAERVLPSEISGVSDAQWTGFVFALRSAGLGDVSASNEYGMFAMKPRRLEDLGVLSNLKCTRAPSDRMVWVGDFVPPLTRKKFLRSAQAQYEVFTKSMRDYAVRLLSDGGLPEGMSLSGALSVLHRCGPSGLQTWADEENRFESTQSLFDATNGMF